MRKFRLSVNLKVMVGILTMMGCVGFIGSKVYLITQQQSNAGNQSLHTHQQISQMKNGRLHLAEMTNSEQYYSASFDESKIDSYNNSRQQLLDEMKDVSEQTEDKQKVDELKSLVELIPSEIKAVEVVKETDNIGEEEVELVYEKSSGFENIEKTDMLLQDMIASSEEVLKVNKALAKQKQKELFGWVIFGTILCSSAAVFTAVIVGIFVTRPLVKLNNVIDALSKGDLTTKIGKKLLNKNDEVGDLARSFDRTMVSLKLAMKRKESKNSDSSEEA